MLYIAVTSILWSLLASELFALQPWLMRMMVRLAARIDADHPDEIDDIYVEHMDGIDALPGHFAKLIAASGLLFRVAVARRVRDGALAAWCGTQLRVGLMRAAIARHLRPSPANPAPASSTEAAQTSLLGNRQNVIQRTEADENAADGPVPVARAPDAPARGQEPVWQLVRAAQEGDGHARLTAGVSWAAAGSSRGGRRDRLGGRRGRSPRFEWGRRSPRRRESWRRRLRRRRSPPGR
jgi:hypothetical protein